MPEIHNEKIPAPVEVPEPTPVKIVPQLISPIDFLTASLGTLASRTIRAPIVHDFNSDTTDFSNTAQAKLQQSLNVYNRSNQADIKDINLNVNNTGIYVICASFLLFIFIINFIHMYFILFLKVYFHNSYGILGHKNEIHHRFSLRY